MRPAALLTVLVLAACGDVGTAERLSSKETLDGIDVPTIGTVGDFPDPAHRHVVNVTADGRVTIDGTIYDAEGLKAELGKRAKRLSRAYGAVTLSEESVVFRIDRRLPWGAAYQALCCACDAKFWRVSFAVRHADESADGAIGLPLGPFSDKPDTNAGDMRGSDEPRSGFDVVPAAGGGSPHGLFAALRRLGPPAKGDFVVWLRVDPAVPTGTALELLDAALRAGATHVGFAGNWAGHRETIDEATAKWGRAMRGGYAVRGLAVEVSAADESMPPVPRRRGEVRPVASWHWPPHEIDGTFPDPPEAAGTISPK